MSGKRHWITVAELKNEATRATVWKRLAVAGAILTAAAFYATAHEAEIIQSLKDDQDSQAMALLDYKARNAELVIELVEQKEVIRQDRADLKAVADAFKYCSERTPLMGSKP